MSRIAIIPARGGSKRIPKKNIASIMGQPMLAYPINSTLISGLFDQVVVSTEDDEIASISKSKGADVWYRSPKLSTDQTIVDEVIRHHLSELKQKQKLPDLICIVYATAILLEPRHFMESLEIILNKEVDSVLAVQEFKPHPFKALFEGDGVLSPVFPDKYKCNTQSFPKYIAPAGAFNWIRSLAFLETSDPVRELRRATYSLESYVAIDIDEPEDMEMAKRLLIAKKAMSEGL